LAIPKNENDLYAVLKKLKELYPNSYPLAFRNGISELSMLAPSWNTDYQMYYKPKAKGFVYGPIEDNFKDMITFYNKLYKEKLIPPNILTLDTKGWQDVMSNSDSFITVDYLSRIDFFNVPMRKTDPNFSLTYMPPMKGGANGVDKFASTSVGTYGFVVSSKSKQRDNALKYVDWFYTQKAAELTSWGEEGKTYNVVDGKKKFIGNSIDVTSLRNNTGLSTWGFYQLFDYDAHISLFSKEVASAYDQSRKDDLPSNTILSFTPQEQEVVNSIGVNIQKATDEQISKFILGTRDLNEWDQYVKEIKALGLDKLKDVYAKAYARKQAVNK
jgi:putative aldouronate transport system substrate-binding protein